MAKLTDVERHEWLNRIKKMGYIEMARLWRFAPSGHPVFDRDNDLYDAFEFRFEGLGGMTPGISKMIGWDD